MKNVKSVSQFRAEQFVTRGLMSGMSLDEIAAGAGSVTLAGGSKRWFMVHVTGFCAQESNRRILLRESTIRHNERLAGLVEIDGHRLEKGRFGAKDKSAWRVWLKAGGHLLVCLNGRAGMTPEEALREALSVRHTGFY